MLTAENISKLYCRKAGKTDCFHAVWPLDLEVRAGDVIAIGPDVPHTFRYTNEETVWLEYFTPGRNFT